MQPETAKIVASVASTFVLVLIVFGLVHRHRRERHVPVMLTAIGIDVANVLFLEIVLAAARKALKVPSEGGSPILIFHIIVSLLTLVGYGSAIYSGRKLLKGGESRRLHRATAMVVIPLRVLNYVTSFYV